MESEKINSFDLKTAVVALLCFLGTGAGAYFLYQDFNQSGGAGRGKPMAKVERRESKVRRKAASSFAWNNVRSDEDLYKRDSVQTSAGSAAAIRFVDGTMLELGENSLVIIDDLTNLSLDFLRGSVVLHTAQGDKRVTVGKDGKTKFEEVPVRLTKPEPLARFFTHEGEIKPVHFAWKAREALPASYTVQVSTDKNFRGTKVQKIEITDGKTLEVDAQLAAGNYFWRLVVEDKPLTESSQFRVVAASALKPVSPSAGEKLLSYNEAPPVQFRWLQQDENALTNGVEHDLQIAKDVEFKSIVGEQAISAVSGLATVKGLPGTDLYWRIRSRYSDIEIMSAVEKFTIGQAARPVLALIQPEDKKTLEIGAQIRLAWSSDAEGLDYQLEVQSPQGKPVFTEKVRSNAFVWKKPLPGPYRWRISAFHKESNVGETGWRAFSVFEGERIALRAPTREQEMYYWEAPIPFTFKWGEDDLAARHPDYSYQVITSHEADFKKTVAGAKTRDTSLASEKLSLTPGDFFWKVQVVDAAGQIIKSSESSHFVHNVYPLLKAPKATAPQFAAVFNLVAQDKNPVATWTEVKDAEAYEVTLYASEPIRTTASGANPSASGTRLVSRFTTTQPLSEFKKLPPANYQWSVRAIDRLKRKGEPAPQSGFTITYGEVLQSPEVTTPEVQ